MRLILFAALLLSCSSSQPPKQPTLSEVVNLSRDACKRLLDVTEPIPVAEGGSGNQ